MTNHGSVGHNVTGHWYLSNSLVDSLLRYRSVKNFSRQGPFFGGMQLQYLEKKGGGRHEDFFRGFGIETVESTTIHR